MIIGDIQDWKRHFVSLDRRVLERIAVVWPRCIAVLPMQPVEDQITINLVALLAKDPVVRRICHWVDYQSEPMGTDARGAKFSKGKIDLAVFLDWERERYLAYECKRLNVVSKNGRSSLATEYVQKGMMRFITEQYAEALPVGCMLGYVMDGHVPFAIGQVSAAIKTHGPLSLINGPTTTSATQMIERFLTNHSKISGGTIELRHALLPFYAMISDNCSELKP